MAAIKYLDLTGLQSVVGSLKTLIADGDANSFKSAKFDETTRVLSLYKTDTTDGVANFTVEIPETDVSGLMEKLSTTNVGNVVITKADGTVEDGGVALADLATKEEVEAVGDVADANKTAIEKLNGDASTDGSVAKAVKDSADAINATIGTVPEGQTVMGIIENIQENAYDDTEIKGLIQDNADAIAAHKEAVDAKVTTLVGDDANKSVRTIANEELAKQLIAEGAAESLDTLEEIAAWIQEHPEDASAMNKAIEDLEALVGTLPEGITATTIVGYIQEAVAAEKTRAEGVESGLDERLAAVEEAMGEDGSVSSQIDAKIAALDADVTSASVDTGKGVQVQVVETDGKITAVNVTGNYDLAYDAAGSATAAQTNAQTYADGLNTAMDTRVDALETKVGDGMEAISTEEINALFA